MAIRKISFWLGILLIGAVLLCLLLAFFAWLHAVGNLYIARRDGVYPNPEAGMRGLIAQGYSGIQKVEIDYAGTNSFDGSQPHVWYVIAKVWADSRSDGSPLHKFGYDNPGSFFLRVRDGWVHVPEEAFPELVGLSMDIFGLEGR
jgi:hypothetical protein